MQLPWPRNNKKQKPPAQNLPPLQAGLRALWRVFKFIRKHPIRTYLAATVAAGAVTTYIPQTVSAPLDDHMAKQGLPALSQHFSTANMRVYDRGNLFQVPHSTFLVAAASAEGFSERPVSTSIGLVTYNISSLIRQLLPGALDAYALGTGTSFDERRCAIRPPRRVAIDDVINRFSGFDVDAYTLTGDKQLMSDIFYVYVLAHEARHCDQFGSSHTVLLHETDADTYALRTIRHIYGDTAEVNQLTGLLSELRTIGAVVHGDSAHATDRAMGRTQHTVLQAVDDQVHSLRLSAVLREVVRMNKDVFKDAEGEFSASVRFYHAAKALIEGPAGRDPQLRRAAAEFISAMDSLAGMTGETVIPDLPQEARSRLTTAFLTSPYVPAPNRVPAPPVAPAA